MSMARLGPSTPRRCSAGRRSVAIALVGVLAVDARAQETEVAPAQAATAGLELTLDLRDSDRISACRFASLQDATLWMGFKNVASEPELIAIDEANRSFEAASLLLDLELARDDGAPLALPAMTFGFAGDAVNSRRWLLRMVPVRWLAPDSSFAWTVKVAELPGWQALELAPGPYRLRVVYHGPPDLTGIPHPDAGALRAWRGRAVSQTLRFEITGAAQELEFGPPQAGLRFAPRPDPFIARWRADERIPMEFVVENATDTPIRITRDLGGSQEDDASIRGADGVERIRNHTMTTGISPKVTLTLAPHARARLYAWPLSIGERGAQAGSGWSEEPAPPGRYVVRYSLLMTVVDPEPVDDAIPRRVRFEIPPRTVEILAPR